MVPLLSVALLSMATVAPAPVQAQATATATMIQPYDAQVLTGTTVSLVWTPVVGATGYYLYIGHTAGAKDVVDSGQLSANTAGYTLPAGTYYVRLWTKVNGTWVYAKDTTFTLGAQTVLSSPRSVHRS